MSVFVLQYNAYWEEQIQQLCAICSLVAAFKEEALFPGQQLITLGLQQHCQLRKTENQLSQACSNPINRCLLHRI